MTIKITHSQLKSFLYTSYQKKVPCFIWGKTGIGKSDTVKNVAIEISKANKLDFLDGDSNGIGSFGFIDVRASQLDPSDLRGLPIVSGEVTRWLSPSWLPRDKDGAGILFCDELNQASPSIMKAFFQLILDRRLGDYVLPDNWLIVSAGNTIEDRADIFEMPAPLSNRFTHVELNIPTKEDWTKWAFKNGISENIISFLEYKPNYLFKFDAKSKDKSFATPRSWNYVSRLIKDSEEDKDTIEILIASAVGEGIAIEFGAFLELRKQIDLNALLEDPKSVKKITELSLKYSLLSGIVEKYREKSENLTKILKICDYMEPEFAILMLRFMRSVKPTFVKELSKTPEWTNLAMKYEKYLLDLKND